MDATGFLTFAKNVFSPITTSQERATYLKKYRAFSRIQWCLHWLSSLIDSEVMAVQKLAGHYSDWPGR